MNQKLLHVKLLICVVLFSFFSTQISAQDGLNKRSTPIPGTTSGGYLEWLPMGYSSSSGKYPLIIYFPGIGTGGNGSEAGLESMFTGSGAPHEQQRSGSWVDNYTNPADGQTYRFVMLYPQFPVNGYIVPPAEVDKIIDFAIATYRIDTTRIYLMGHSQGAGTVWDYPGASSRYANRVAAIVPFGGVSFPFKEKANRMKYAKTAVWAFHANQDQAVPFVFSQQYVMFYNQAPAPAIPAKLTAPNSTGHDVWSGPLNRAAIPGEQYNVYEWMLQYKREHTTVFAGEDQEIEINLANSVQLNGQGTGPNGSTTGISWTKIYGPAAGGITSPNIINPQASNLVEGTYIFRLTLTDNAGATYSDDVAITVNPGFQRIEAESFIRATSVPEGSNPANAPGVVLSSTEDPPGTPAGTKVDGIGRTDQGVNEWLDYSVTVPSAGVYTLRFRAGTGTGGTSIKIKDAGGNTLDTIMFYAGTGYDNYMNFFAFNVSLQAGTQTIRIQNGDVDYPLGAFRQWYFNYFDIINLPTQNPLPVRFSQFNANCRNNSVALSWKTSSEINAKEFSVEKSANGSTWTVVGTLPAGGQSSLERSYTFTDANGGNAVYRIVAHDFDGKKTLSSVIRSNCNGKADISVFPNPVQDQAMLSVSLQQGAKLNVRLVDSKGATVRDLSYNLTQGTTQLPISMSGLPSGTYTLVARWDNEVQTVRIVKK